MAGRHSRNGFLCRQGLKEAAQREVFSPELAGVVAERVLIGYFDKVGSVSALAEAEDFFVFDDQLLENQFQRNFHNGS